jgi:hypothetical protein
LSTRRKTQTPFYFEHSKTVSTLKYRTSQTCEVEMENEKDTLKKAIGRARRKFWERFHKQHPGSQLETEMGILHARSSREARDRLAKILKEELGGNEPTWEQVSIFQMGVLYAENRAIDNAKTTIRENGLIPHRVAKPKKPFKPRSKNYDPKRLIGLAGTKKFQHSDGTPNCTRIGEEMHVDPDVVKRWIDLIAKGKLRI